MHQGGPIFSPLGDKSSMPKGNFDFFGFYVPIMFHVCSHKVPSEIPHMCSTSSQCVNPNMFPIAPHIKQSVLPKIELS
jgi:hypothetical protein